ASGLECVLDRYARDFVVLNGDIAEFGELVAGGRRHGFAQGPGSGRDIAEGDDAVVRTVGAVADLGGEGAVAIEEAEARAGEPVALAVHLGDHEITGLGGWRGGLIGDGEVPRCTRREREVLIVRGNEARRRRGFDQRVVTS